MERLKRMSVFAKVVEFGSFTAAARQLQMSVSSISQTVSKLEDELQVKLLNRSTRSIGLTEAGKIYYQGCRRMLHEVQDVHEQLYAFNNTPIGTLRIGCSSTMAQNVLAGLTAKMLQDANDLMLERGTGTGPNILYLETGQGSELSSDSHNGWDQVTMEARCYGFARHYRPFLLNTVVGFIGPEYLYDSKQVIRAGLEDHFMGKLSGIPMGCDACYTNHMKADQNDIENLSVLLAAAKCNYIIGVPQGDDCMLMYQSAAYHDMAALREIFNLRPVREFDRWLEKMGFSEDGKLTDLAGDGSVFLV